MVNHGWADIETRPLTLPSLFLKVGRHCERLRGDNAINYVLYVASYA